MADPCFILGLLLREIKDFWRPALLLSTILYYDDIDSSSSFEQSKLDKSIVLFNQFESAVTTQGIGLTISITSKLIIAADSSFFNR